MTKHILTTLLLISSISLVFGQTDTICSFKFSNNELDIKSNQDYKLNDSIYYSCYNPVNGIISKESLLSQIKDWDLKDSKISIQKIVLTQEEQKKYNTKTQVIIVTWEKFKIDTNSKKRKQIIERVIKNCS